MNRLKWFGAVVSALTVALGVTLAAAASDGCVAGTLGLRLSDGTVAHGDWIRVLLTTAPVTVPTADIPADLPFFVRKDRINDLHLNFFVNVRKRMTDPGFVAASTLTTEDGSFLFPAVPPGDYQVLVTFPAVIAGAKVAWQVPIRVDAGGQITVALNGANAALPIALESVASSEDGKDGAGIAH